MDYFQNKGSEVYCEGVALRQIAERYGTPVYVYSRATLVRHCREFIKAFANHPTLPCYAVKANSTLGFLREIAREGFGADIVSGGELERSLLAGFAPSKIVYSGVGKTNAELQRALEVGIYCINVESLDELNRLSGIAASMSVVAPVSLRVNPHVDARTHPKISTGLYETKFGIDQELAAELIKQCAGIKSIKLIGLSCHIGSQLLDLAPLKEAAAQMVLLAKAAVNSGAKLEFLGMGGGLGIKYKSEVPPSLADYAETLIGSLRGLSLNLIVEPGRVIAGNTGILLTRVIGLKQTPLRNFVVVDASMSELIRPAMYDSYHDIEPVQPKDEETTMTYDIVGPVCETSDTLGHARKMPLIETDDLLMIRSCGAYGSSMSSNYNSRPKPAEVLVDGDGVELIRSRQTLADLWILESV